MNQRPTITISLLPTDDELWKFIQMKREQGKISGYIRDLIRKDMLKEPEPQLLNEATIVQQILLALENKNVIKVVNSEIVNEMDFIDGETKNTILNLF